MTCFERHETFLDWCDLIYLAFQSGGFGIYYYHPPFPDLQSELTTFKHHGQSGVERIDRRSAWDETSAGGHLEPDKSSNDAECQSSMSNHMSISEHSMCVDQNVHKNIHHSISRMGRL